MDKTVLAAISRREVRLRRIAAGLDPCNGVSHRAGRVSMAANIGYGARDTCPVPVAQGKPQAPRCLRHHQEGLRRRGRAALVGGIGGSLGEPGRVGLGRRDLGGAAPRCSPPQRSGQALAHAAVPRLPAKRRDLGFGVRGQRRLVRWGAPAAGTGRVAVASTSGKHVAKSGAGAVAAGQGAGTERKGLLWSALLPGRACRGGPAACAVSVAACAAAPPSCRRRLSAVIVVVVTPAVVPACLAAPRHAQRRRQAPASPQCRNGSLNSRPVG
mmetsp:Transcript_11471/g.44456  ORF Transcript_11471/g.44456 Transcript_11471/m.44456 type:complete len:270 (+) Transcript_11471:5088-5897(+)